MDKIAKKSLEKLPPYNLEAEQAVLGAILLDHTAIYKALEIFDPEDFYRKSHQKIFDAMLELIDRSEAVDLLLLRDELDRRKELDEIGGPAYLAALVDQVPTAANIEFHAKIVHEKAVARNLLNVSIEIATRCYDDAEDVNDILEDAEQKIFTIAEGKVKQGFTPLSIIVKESYEKIEALAERKSSVTGVPTGFRDLDYMTSGLQPSDLIIIAGRPSTGKTALALNMGFNAAQETGKGVAVFSLEMAKMQLGMRLLGFDAGIDATKLRTGFLRDTDWMKLTESADHLSKLPIFIDDTSWLSVLEMKAKCRRLKKKTDLSLVVIDYLQLIQGRRSAESRQMEISEISRSLKALAKDLQVPVIALSQLNRKVEDRPNKRPQLSDLRESGAIEQDADVIAFIYRDELYHPTTEENRNVAEIILAKQRNGPTGLFKLTFQKELTRFRDYAREEGYDS